MAPPTISSFAADPTSQCVESLDGASGPATLAWNVSGATSVSISPAPGGNLPPQGSSDVPLTQTTTFTLSATNAGGTTTANLTVYVEETPYGASLTLNPTQVATGSSATLSWSVPSGAKGDLQPGIGSVSGSGERAVSPTSTTSYTLTASSAHGCAVTRTQTLTVLTLVPTIVRQPTVGIVVRPTPTPTPVPVY